MTERLTPGGSPVLALLLLLVVDMGIGLWLKLHKPEYLPLFIVVNAPTIGVTGFFWPLLPKEAKDRIGAGLARVLGSPLSVRVLLLSGGVLFLTSLFFASIRVELLDSGTVTTLHLVRGTQGAPDSAALADAMPLRLNRLTTPRSAVLGVPPTGQRVWIHSPTHVLFLDAKLFPWLPARVQYPADFVLMANVAVLPGYEAMTKLRLGPLRLDLKESKGGAVLASKDLDTTGTLIGFFRPSPIAPEDSARWRRWLTPPNGSADDENIALMLHRWLLASWVPAARPLRQGDTLFWTVRSSDSTSRDVAAGRLVLNAALADLYLKF